MERDGDLILLALARGKANALNKSMVEAFVRGVELAERDDSVRGLVLASDNPRLFSGGFDVHEVFGYDDKTMRAFFGRFIDLLEGLRHLPKPTVAAVSGHAYAGGALVVLACDLRIFAEGDTRFAVNEVNLGVVLPEPLLKVLAVNIGLSSTRQLLLFGDVFRGAQALHAGLVDEMAPPREVLTRAIGCARMLAAKPALAYAAHKRTLAMIAGPRLEGSRREEALDHFMRCWSGNESRTARQKLLETMGQESGIRKQESGIKIAE